MSKNLRGELVGIAALVGGLFLGLTLLPWDLTGGLGSGLGRLLLRAFGAGALLIPIMGVGWALAAFGRLGHLSTLRTAALFAGLILLIPYAVGITVGGAGRAPLPADYAQWSFGQKVVGLVPGFLAGGMRQVIGTAGGVLLGLFALSALGLVTVGWHPLAALRAREPGSGKREAGSGKREAGTTFATAFEEDRDLIEAAPAKDKQGNGRGSREKKVAPRRPLPASRFTPHGLLIPPIDLLTEPPPA
ncbi:MAG: hypothetical protein ACREKK_11840, partial [Candidatus Methylomirabilales bacterium]